MSTRGKVTITLGHSGQVVKRSASDIEQYNQARSSGSMRPLRGRLGSKMEGLQSNGTQSSSKRQRRDDPDQGSNGDHLVSRDDLRYKLMQKTMSSRSKFSEMEREHGDLREKLSRHAQRPLRAKTRVDFPESRGPGLVRRIPPTRSADDLLHIDSSRRSHPSWVLDGQRRRSPDRLVGSSRGISPPRSCNELRRVPSFRLIDDSRLSSFPAKGVDIARPIPYQGKPVVTMEAPKTVVRVPQTSDLVHKSSYMAEQPPVTVSSLLHRLGLEKYAILFQAEEVDMTALKQMGDNDLKDLGIPMGPRKKILLAVQPRQKRHT